MHVLTASLADVARTRALDRMGHLAQWLGGRVDDVTLERFLAAEAFRADPFVYRYLRHHLEGSGMVVAGQPARMMSRDLLGERLDVPVAVVSTGQVRLLPLPPFLPVDREPGWTAVEYVQIQRRLGRVIEDRECYTARRIHLSAGDASIAGGLTTYGSALADQDVLEWELLHEAAQYFQRHRERPDYAALTRRLRRRRELEDRTPNYLLDGGGRHNALAMSILLAYPASDGHRLMLGKRSATTGAHADLFHVIPACMLQPELGDVPREWDMMHAFLKEYGEELFQERLEPNAVDSAYFYRSWPGVAALRAAIEAGRCSFTTTGMVVNLLNLRPEICCLLLVRDEAWWRRQQRAMRLNWEYIPRQQINLAFERQGRTWTDLRLDAAEADYLDYFGASPGQWVPSGLAALWLGVDAARRLLAR